MRADEGSDRAAHRLADLLVDRVLEDAEARPHGEVALAKREEVDRGLARVGDAQRAALGQALELVRDGLEHRARPALEDQPPDLREPLALGGRLPEEPADRGREEDRHDPLAEPDEPLLDVAGRRLAAGGEARAERLALGDDRGDEERLLVAEVAVDRGLRDPGPRRDEIDARSLVAELSEDEAGRGEDLFTLPGRGGCVRVVGGTAHDYPKLNGTVLTVNRRCERDAATGRVLGQNHPGPPHEPSTFRPERRSALQRVPARERRRRGTPPLRRPPRRLPGR